MFSLSKHPQSIGHVLKNGIRLYRIGFGKGIWFGVLFGLLSILPDVVMPDWPEALLHGRERGKLAFIIGMSTLPGMILSVAILQRYWGLARDRDLGFKDALRRGWELFLPMFLTTLLYGACVMLGLMLLIVPGLILMVSLMLYSNALVIDNTGALAGLKLSHRLVWGHWWRTSTVLSAPMMMFLLLLILLYALLGVAEALWPALSEFPFDFPGLLIDVMIYALVFPLFYAVSIVQYHDLKLRRERGDWLARVAQQ